MNKLTSYLYARPSLLEGIARLLDIGGTLSEYNTSEQADALAIYSDWLVVGDDLRKVLRSYPELEDGVEFELTEEDKILLSLIGQ
ncbi:MAG: hypothetical protein SW833_22230 [Cyanobacteriota bacterium]|nr:hypothetical protein [Cyanobacteriota bacterium]